MNIFVVNNDKTYEYERFKNICPDAEERNFEDGSKQLVIKKGDEIIFQLDYIKKGPLSESDIFVVKNWGTNPENAEQIVDAYNHFSMTPISLPKDNQSLETADDELLRFKREERKFTILQRERTMNSEQKAKNKSAILAGMCILGAAVAVHFNNLDINTVIQHELNAIYSWEALGQYFQDLGPLTTLLCAGASSFIAKYFKHSKKYKQACEEFIDFNASLENNFTKGGR